MQTPDIIKLVAAVVLGYGIMFLAMWIFRGRKEEKKGKN